MKQTDIYDMWTEFINHPDYKEYLLSAEDDWKNNLNNTKKYIDKNKKTPSHGSKDKDIKSLGSWFSDQKANYKNKTYIMKQTDIYDMWTEFINHPDYKEYLLSADDDWKNKIDKMKKYIDKNKKTPSERSKDKDIKSLGSWFRHQKNNYKNKTSIMKQTDIYDIWTEFINHPDYKEYIKNNNDIENITANPVLNLQIIPDNDIHKKSQKHQDYLEKKDDKYNCKCGSKITNNVICINHHKNMKKHQDYLEKCVHLWKVIRDDEKYNYKKCELCGSDYPGIIKI